MSKIPYWDIHSSPDSLATTVTVGYVCDHANGWFVTVKFWIFPKYVFVCSDCGHVDYKRKP